MGGWKVERGTSFYSLAPGFLLFSLLQTLLPHSLFTKAVLFYI